MKELLLALLNGVTVASLYFIAATGFALVFGFLRVVNLAHGSLFLLGAYIGWSTANRTGSWLLGAVVAMASTAAVAAAVQVFILRRARGDIFREALMTIGVAMILADLMLTFWGGDAYQIDAPAWLDRAIELPYVGRYSLLRISAIVVAVALGGVSSWALSYTRLGSLIRAGVDDHEMVASLGFNVGLMQTLAFAAGAAIVAFAGTVGATVLSISPGEDARYLLISLIVVIVGGMGSIAGTALGALLIGLAEQLGLTYTPTYAVTYTFLLLIVTLAFKPQGLLGRADR